MVECFGDYSIHFNKSDCDKWCKDYILDGGSPLVTEYRPVTQAKQALEKIGEL